LHDVDEYLQSQLLLAAMLITTHVLCEGGTFVAKIFRGRNVGFLTSQLRLMFERVSVAKPTSSRNSSMESFVVCQRFIGAPFFDLPLDVGGYVNVKQLVNRREGGNDVVDDDCEERSTMESVVLPFLACGDLSGWTPEVIEGGQDGDVVVLDSDKSYPIPHQKHDDETTTTTNSRYIPPLAPPIEPPYEESIAREREERRKRA